MVPLYRIAVSPFATILAMNKRSRTTRLPLDHETIRVLDDKQLSVVAAGDGNRTMPVSQCERCVRQ